jgi:hypothetical protein
MLDWTKVKHFTQDEFDDPTSPGSGANMVGELVFMLDAARELAGVPFIIESGYRTVGHNRVVGGAPSSAHLTGEAVDIKVQNSAVRWNMLVALLAVGFDRIEIKPGDLHVDVAKDALHPRERIMVMNTKTGQLQ